MEAMAISVNMSSRIGYRYPSACVKKRISRASIPPLDTVAIKAVTGAGAPSYTSGVHMWKGTTPSLKPTPTITSPNPVRSRRGSSCTSARKEAIPAKAMEPVLA